MNNPLSRRARRLITGVLASSLALTPLLGSVAHAAEFNYEAHENSIVDSHNDGELDVLAEYVAEYQTIEGVYASEYPANGYDANKFSNDGYYAGSPSANTIEGDAAVTAQNVGAPFNISNVVIFWDDVARANIQSSTYNNSNNRWPAGTRFEVTWYFENGEIFDSNSGYAPSVPGTRPIIVEKYAGRELIAVVTVSNGLDRVETATSASSGPILGWWNIAYPGNDLVVGDILTIEPDGWQLPTHLDLHVTWRLDNANTGTVIGNEETLAIQPGHLGRTIWAVITVVDASGQEVWFDRDSVRVPQQVAPQVSVTLQGNPGWAPLNSTVEISAIVTTNQPTTITDAEFVSSWVIAQWPSFEISGTDEWIGQVVNPSEQLVLSATATRIRAYGETPTLSLRLSGTTDNGTWQHASNTVTFENQAPQVASPFRVTFDTDRQLIQAGETVNLTLEVTNTSASEATITTVNFNSSQYLAVAATPEWVGLIIQPGESLRFETKATLAANATGTTSASFSLRGISAAGQWQTHNYSVQIRVAQAVSTAIFPSSLSGSDPLMYDANNGVILINNAQYPLASDWTTRLPGQTRGGGHYVSQPITWRIDDARGTGAVIIPESDNSFGIQIENHGSFVASALANGEVLETFTFHTLNVLNSVVRGGSHMLPNYVGDIPLRWIDGWQPTLWIGSPLWTSWEQEWNRISEITSITEFEVTPDASSRISLRLVVASENWLGEQFHNGSLQDSGVPYSRLHFDPVSAVTPEEVAALPEIEVDQAVEVAIPNEIAGTVTHVAVRVTAGANFSMFVPVNSEGVAEFALVDIVRFARSIDIEIPVGVTLSFVVLPASYDAGVHVVLDDQPIGTGQWIDVPSIPEETPDTEQEIEVPEQPQEPEQPEEPEVPAVVFPTPVVSDPVAGQPVYVSVAEGWTLAHIHGWHAIVDGQATALTDPWDQELNTLTPGADWVGALLRVRVQIFNNEDPRVLNWQTIYSAPIAAPLVDPEGPAEPAPVLPEPEVTVVSSVVTAVVNRLNGNQNEVVVVLTETLSNGVERVTQEVFRANNNSDNTFVVGGNRIFVSVRGNTQVREIANLGQSG